MTPLDDDSGYLTEVTSCLSQSIVRLLEIRPDDPIEFIAHYLKNHRRQNPRSGQGEELSVAQRPESNEAVVSHKTTHSKTPTDSPSSQQPNIVPHPRAAVIVNVNDNNDDEGVDSDLGAYLVRTDTLIHKESLASILAMGDLFDDNDFG